MIVQSCEYKDFDVRTYFGTILLTCGKFALYWKLHKKLFLQFLCVFSSNSNVKLLENVVYYGVEADVGYYFII